MQIQRLVDLEDYEFDTLLVTYNHKNRLSIELGKVSEIFESLQADGLVGGSKVYGLRGKDFSYPVSYTHLVLFTLSVLRRLPPVDILRMDTTFLTDTSFFSFFNNSGSSPVTFISVSYTHLISTFLSGYF